MVISYLSIFLVHARCYNGTPRATTGRQSLQRREPPQRAGTLREAAQSASTETPATQWYPAGSRAKRVYGNLRNALAPLVPLIPDPQSLFPDDPRS